MAEKIVSPGVFSTEIDASYLPAAIGDIGACVIGPTVKGPALVPTVVESYSEYQAKFGDTFKSGSNYFQYLTSHAAENYLKHGSKLTVVRILDGEYTPATASMWSSNVMQGAAYASGSLVMQAGDFDIDDELNSVNATGDTRTLFVKFQGGKDQHTYWDLAYKIGNYSIEIIVILKNSMI